MGEPTSAKQIEDSDGTKDIWEYVAAASDEFGWQPDSEITFVGGSITKILYKEYGLRNYGENGESNKTLHSNGESAGAPSP